MAELKASAESAEKKSGSRKKDEGKLEKLLPSKPSEGVNGPPLTADWGLVLDRLDGGPSMTPSSRCILAQSVSPSPPSPVASSGRARDSL